MNIIQNNFPGVCPDRDIIHVLENVRRAGEHEDKIKRILINLIITIMIMINITMITTTTIIMITITSLIIQNTPHVRDNARIRKENHGQP